MSPKRGFRRGAVRGRGRGLFKRRGPRPRNLLSPSPTTADDTDAETPDSSIFVKQEKKLKRSPTRSPTPSRKNNVDYYEERELSLPQLKPTTIPENSTISSMFNSHDKYSNYIMTDDELEHVQWDLETLLTINTIHRNIIRDELNTFASMPCARSQHTTTKNPKLPMIRPRAAAEIAPVNECQKVKLEFDHKSTKELPPRKTESANKFWSLVEPYLAHIQKEDLIWLEDLVKSYNPSMNLYEIPPLGEHYSKNWAKEELEMQKSQSSCSPGLAKKNKLSERISPEVVELVNKVNSSVNDNIEFTPVYQRVVAALVEHSYNMSIEDSEDHFLEFDDEDKPHEMSNACNEFFAEQNVKKQLHKLGLLSPQTKPVQSSSLELPPSFAKSDRNEHEHDEVLEELMKCDNALAQLQEINKNHLTKLLERCRKDYYQQIIKKKIETINNKILNFKRQQNELWTNETNIDENDYELQSLLDQRNNYLLQLRSMALGCMSPYASDDSDSSDEESVTFKLPEVKNEPSGNDTEVKEEVELTVDGSQFKEYNEHTVEFNIKQEVVDDRMDFDEAYYDSDNDGDVDDIGGGNNNDIDVDDDICSNNDIGSLINDNNEDEKGIECDKQVLNEEVNIEALEKTINEMIEIEKINESKDDLDDQTELEFHVNVQEDVTGEDDNSSAIKPNILCQKNSDKGTSESEQIFQIESLKPVEMNQDITEYEPILNVNKCTTKEILGSNKINGAIHHERFDGSSGESYYTDMSD